MLLLGCASLPRENGFHRTARDGQRDRLQLLREQQERDLHVLSAAILEDREHIRRLRDEAVVAASRRREAELASAVEQRQLDAAAARLVALQQENGAVLAQADAVQAAKAAVELRQLELQSLQQQLTQLDVQLAAARRELAAKAAAIEPRLRELRDRLDAVGQLDAQLTAALQQVTGATDKDAAPATPAATPTAPQPK